MHALYRAVKSTSKVRDHPPPASRISGLGGPGKEFWRESQFAKVSPHRQRRAKETVPLDFWPAGFVFFQTVVEGAEKKRDNGASLVNLGDLAGLKGPKVRKRGRPP